MTTASLPAKRSVQITVGVCVRGEGSEVQKVPEKAESNKNEKAKQKGGRGRGKENKKVVRKRERERERELLFLHF